MTFSIIIATCDRPERLTLALGAIKVAIGEEGKGHKIIVVDNGQTVSAKEAVAAFRQSSGLDVEYIETEPRNKSKALNAGIARAATEWLAFTDDDCLPDREWLLSAARCAETTEWRIFGGRVVPGLPEKELPAWLKPGRSGRVPWGGAFVRYNPMPGSGALSLSHPVPLGANVFVMKSVFEKYGGYDEMLWAVCGRAALGVEDAEFGIRLRSRGEQIGYCHESIVCHPVNPERYGILSHMRSAYYYGWRDPIVYFQPDRPLVEAHRLKSMIVLGAASVADLVSGDIAGVVDCWTGVARNFGAVVCRLSAAYAKRAGMLELKRC